VAEPRDRKPVIVVVDIDDDLSQVLGRSLVRGEREVAEAVLEYGLKRPEDADVNAMLAGLSLYREMREKGLDPEIIVVGGHPYDNLEAQRNIKKRVREVVEDIGGPVEFYIVSDGEDEFVVAELLHDLGEIGGFKRVVVEQHLGIEGGYILVLRYLRKAINDPRYSRYLVGVPGIGLLLLAFTAMMDVASIALELLALLLGAAMVVHGFRLEPYLEAWARRLAESVRENPYFTTAGIMVLLLFTAAGVYSAYEAYSAAGLSARALGSVMKTSVPLIGAGVASYLLISRIFHKASMGDLSIVREVEAMIVTVFVTIAFYNLGSYLEGVQEGEAIPLSAFLQSGFIQYVIIGTGLAAIIEILWRGTRRQASGQSSSSSP